MTKNNKHSLGRCPNCGKKFGCPCDSCKLNFPEQYTVAIITTTPDNISLLSCPYCNFTAAYDWWEILSYDICAGNNNSIEHLPGMIQKIKELDDKKKSANRKGINNGNS